MVVVVWIGVSDGVFVDCSVVWKEAVGFECVVQGTSVGLVCDNVFWVQVLVVGGGTVLLCPVCCVVRVVFPKRGSSVVSVARLVVAGW